MDLAFAMHVTLVGYEQVKDNAQNVMLGKKKIIGLLFLLLLVETFGLWMEIFKYEYNLSRKNIKNNKPYYFSKRGYEILLKRHFSCKLIALGV